MTNQEYLRRKKIKQAIKSNKSNNQGPRNIGPRIIHDIPLSGDHLEVIMNIMTSLYMKMAINNKRIRSN